MPRTPRAVRPMGRTSDSSKRMASPSCVAMKMRFVPSVSITSSSSSPSSTLTALMPFERMLRNSDSSVFLMTPLRVTITT